MRMRVEIYIRCADLTAAVKFYVAESALFEVLQNFDGESVLVKSRFDSAMTLLLSESIGVSSESSPIFSMGVPDGWVEYQRLKSVHFSGSAGFFSHEGVPEFLSHPFGRGFAMRDPSGNVFSVQQYFS